MSLGPGSRLAQFEILGRLGAGAMGEVWRARDTRLGREVAIKVLPEHFPDDKEHLKHGPLPLDEGLDVCRQIAEGLEAAHEAGVIHRDLKPANVRLTPEGAGSRIVHRWGSTWYEVELAFGPGPASSAPRALFQGPYYNTPGMSWDSPDGKRFLVIEEPELERLVTTLEVVTDFGTELRRRMSEQRGE